VATITLKNVPDALYLRLKGEAAKHRRSLNQEAIHRLEAGLDAPAPEELLRLIRVAHDEQVRAGVWIDHARTTEYIREGRR
jgi:antitoxin FitA